MKIAILPLIALLALASNALGAAAPAATPEPVGIRVLPVIIDGEQTIRCDRPHVYLNASRIGGFRQYDGGLPFHTHHPSVTCPGSHRAEGTLIWLHEGIKNAGRDSAATLYLYGGTLAEFRLDLAKLGW